MKKQMQCMANAVGRVVIPSEIRSALKLTSGTPVEIYVENNSICITKYQAGCAVCGITDSVKPFRGKYVCEACIDEARQMFDIQVEVQRTNQAL